MDAVVFVQELDAFKTERLSPIVGPSQTSLLGGVSGDAKTMLQLALANEISVSELAAAWMPSTPEVDVKIALARQAGDEARHFELVADRLVALGFELAGFQPPAANPQLRRGWVLPASQGAERRRPPYTRRSRLG